MFLDQLGKRRLIVGLLPLAAWFERDEHVGQFDPHWVGRGFRRPNATPHMLDLVRKLGENGLLHLRIKLDRIVQIGPRESHDTYGNRSLGKSWHELGAEIRSDDGERQI